MLPEHSNPTQFRRGRQEGTFWATAPYNFVPLPEKVYSVSENSILNQDSFTGKTGYVECKLTTESPLYIRSGMTPEFFSNNGKKSFHELEPEEKNVVGQFFHKNDPNCPLIPGSSLRGMIRSIVEIAGYGKIQWVTDDKKITFRAVAASSDDPLSVPYKDFIGKYGKNLKAGYLVNNGDKWFISPAKKPSDVGLNSKDEFIKIKEKYIQKNELPTFVDLNDKDYIPQYHEVSFDASLKPSKHGKFISISKIGSRDKEYNYKGILVCSGNMRENSNDNPSPRCNHVLILEKNPIAKQLSIDDGVIEDYIGSLTTFQKEKPFSENMGCLEDGRPVFYVSKDNKVLFFGHNPYFRVPAIPHGNDRTATPKYFVPESIRNPQDIDIAESIFGYAADEDRKQGRAGRVYFTDAVLESANTDIWLTKNGPIHPQILASPKPTTFQHYLVQDESKGHDPDDKASLAHYATPTPCETVIRGSKMYWHKRNVSEDTIKERGHVNENDKQHTKIRPIKTGVTFTFRIYFENLTDCELGALLWALTLPGKQDKKYRHKLGMGKPLGLGSVRIEPTLRISDRKKRYMKLFEKNSDVKDNTVTFCEGIDQKSDISHLTKLFEDDILDFLKSEFERLHQVERIKMLFKMLEWPGPDNEYTKYLSIQPNEYKERPVLPDPFNIGKPRR